MLKQLLNLLVVFALAACAPARGFDRGALQKELKGDIPQVTEQDIKQALALKPNLTLPAKIAVYLKDGSTKVSQMYAVLPRWRWEGGEKDQIIEWGHQLKSDGVVSDLFFIPQSMVPNNSLHAIRLAAAQHGADAVFVIDGIADVDRYHNASSILYIAIVTGLFVPGTHIDALFMINGTLWDVRNQYLYLTIESESVAEKLGPAFFMKEKKSINEAKSQAIEKFGLEFKKRMASLAGKN